MNTSSNESVILISSKNLETNKDFGTGFLIHQEGEISFVLTCAHVIKDVGGEEAIMVAGKPAEVVASGEEKGFDLTVVAVENLSNTKPFPLCSTVQEGTPFTIIGYYEQQLLQRNDQPPRFRRKIEGHLGQRIQSPSKDQSEHINLWDLKISSEELLKPGYSGSPVISKTGEVMAIVNLRIDHQGQKGLAISIETLEKVWTEMPIKIQQRVPKTPKLSTSPAKYSILIDLFSRGIDRNYCGVVPFLGAGVNLCSSFPPNLIEIVSNLEKSTENNLVGVPCSVCPIKIQQWSKEQWSIPEDCPILKQIRAETTDGQPVDPKNCPLSNEQMLTLAKINLRLLSQVYLLRENSEELDSEELYRKIREIFEIAEKNITDNKRNQNQVNQFLASLPERLRRKGYKKLPYQLILTTNYDEGLEKAFLKEEQLFDLIYYVAEGQEDNRCGYFRHQTYKEICDNSDGQIIGNDYNRELPWNKHPIIVKFFGTLAHEFVVTEGHHINYLNHDNLSDVLPIDLLQVLKNKINKNRLFLLGYSLNDADFELVLNRFPEKPKKFFVVHQSKLGSLEKWLWSRRGLNMDEESIRTSLEDCIENLDKGIKELPDK